MLGTCCNTEVQPSPGEHLTWVLEVDTAQKHSEVKEGRRDLAVGKEEREGERPYKLPPKD